MTARQHPAKWADTGDRCRATWCECGAPILRGYDNDRIAFLAHCDPQPISALGEAIAITNGQHTYQLETKGKGYALTRRNTSAITTKPAGQTTPGHKWDVLAEHRCGQTPTHTTPTNFTHDTHEPISYDTLPPF